MADATASLALHPERAVAIGAAGRQRVLAHYTQDKAVTACAPSMVPDARRMPDYSKRLFRSAAKGMPD